MIVEKFNLKDMILWNGVHSGITATSERLNCFADTILLNTQALFIWFIVILLFDSSYILILQDKHLYNILVFLLHQARN